MASEGQARTLLDGSKPSSRSKANMVDNVRNQKEGTPPIQGENLEKLKCTIQYFVFIGEAHHQRVAKCFHNGLYVKFLGKAPPLEVVQRVLVDRWKIWGSCSVTDMPNGYFLVQCENIGLLKKVSLKDRGQ